MINKKTKYFLILGIIILLVILLVLWLVFGTAKNYDVIFNTNGGTAVENIVVKKNGILTKPEDPKKEGYVFIGWYYNGNPFDFTTEISEDMVLEARWGEIGKVSGVSLNKNDVSLHVGDTYKFELTILPSDAKNKNVTWKSSDSSVVSVDKNGNIKGLKVGTATITVTTEDGSFTAKATIKVTEVPKVSVSGVSLNKSNVSLYVGNSTKLVATVKPSDATNKGVTWKSSNTSVVSVDKNGNIKGLKAGTATITVTTNDGKYTAKATITVTNAPKISVTGVSLNKTSVDLYIGNSTKLVATVKPSNATNKGVTWKSSNTSVVSVDKNGNIKGLKAGTATITVTTNDGSYTATCKVTIKEKPASYTVQFSPIVQEATNAVVQYSMTVYKNSSSLTNYNFVIYNNVRIAKNNNLAVGQYNKSITTAKIRLSDGTEVTATVSYR